MVVFNVILFVGFFLMKNILDRMCEAERADGEHYMYLIVHSTETMRAELVSAPVGSRWRLS